MGAILRHFAPQDDTDDDCTLYREPTVSPFELEPMPKMKSKSGARKRFKLTATGRVKREKAYRSHILTSKSRKRKRSLRHDTIVVHADEKRIKKVL
jgi:large subunit ribosomal protein L35